MAISLAAAYSQGRLTEEGISNRNACVLGAVFGGVVVLLAGGLTAYVCSPHFAAIKDLFAVVVILSMILVYMIGTAMIMGSLSTLYAPLDGSDRMIFMPPPPEQKDKLTAQEDLPSLFYRIKASLACFNQTIKEGSFQTF